MLRPTVPEEACITAELNCGGKLLLLLLMMMMTTEASSLMRVEIENIVSGIIQTDTFVNNRIRNRYDPIRYRLLIALH